MEKVFKHEEGRRRFMSWLFRLADQDHTGNISVAELTRVLQAVERDGIKTEEFFCSDEVER